MKRFILILLFFITSTAFSQTRTTLAILGFINKGDKSDNYYNSMISGSLSSFLSKLKELNVLPYSEVKKVVSNQGLIEKNEIDVEMALDIGVMLGANQVLIGDYIVSKKDKEIRINFYVYDVRTGDLKLKRSYKGKTDMDFFDTMDKMITIVGSLLLSRPIFLGKLIIEIDTDEEYLVYINDSFQKKVSRKESFSESVLADENFILSLKNSRTMNEVYRNEIFVKNNESYYLKYVPYGHLIINAKGFEGAEIYTNEVFYGNIPESGECILSNIKSGIEYSVYLKKEDFTSEKKKVKIEEGKTASLAFEIKKATKVKLPAEKKVISISGWNITGYVMSGLGLLGLGAGYYFNMEAKRYYDLAGEKYDEYRTATSDFDAKWNAYEEAFKNFNTMLLARNIGYITGGVFLGAGLILSFLPSKSQDKNFSFEISPNYIFFKYKYEF